MDDIPEFADVVPDRECLDGDKMPLESIINLPLVFIGWEIAKSKYREEGHDQRLTLQFIYNNQHRVCFTGSNVLIEQIQAFDAVRDKSKPKAFRAVIRKIDRFYKFCRTTENDK